MINTNQIKVSGIQSVTPEEARNKICVMSDTSTCVADRCMAWRKDLYTVIHPENQHKCTNVENGKGYCGMVYHK